MPWERKGRVQGRKAPLATPDYANRVAIVQECVDAPSGVAVGCAMPSFNQSIIRAGSAAPCANTAFVLENIHSTSVYWDPAVRQALSQTLRPREDTRQRERELLPS